MFNQTGFNDYQDSTVLVNNPYVAIFLEQVVQLKRTRRYILDPSTHILKQFGKLDCTWLVKTVVGLIT